MSYIHYGPNLIYVVNFFNFFTDSVIIYVLKWVHRYPTHQNNICLEMIKKVNYWLQWFLVYIEFWVMANYWHYSPNFTYVVKLLIYVTYLVITCVLKWVNRSQTHQNNVFSTDWESWSLITIIFRLHRVLGHGKLLAL